MNRHSNWNKAAVRQSTLGRTVGSAAREQAPPPLLSRNQLLFHERRARQQSGENLSLPAVLLLLAATGYNGALAFLNAHGLPVGRAVVVITEILVLSAVAIVIMTSGRKRVPGAPALFFAFFLVNALIVSVFSGAIYVEMARNTAIIALFSILGGQISGATLTRCFVYASIAVGAVLLLEIISTPTYAAQFMPAEYFADTRGNALPEYDDSGLFGNALGYEDRFSILNIIDHRAASLFLEQVSLANFAIVTSIFLCCRWRQVGTGVKLFLIPLIALIVITTASRSATGLVLAAPLAYWLAPKLSRFVPLLVMPAALLISFIISLTSQPTSADVLEGRVSLTIRNLGRLDIASLAGTNALNSSNFADSGYVYVIVASSIIGLLVLWLYGSLFAAGVSAETKRCNLMLGLYFFGNLTVSGTSNFSIKTAALLWLLAGFMREWDRSKEATTEPALRPAPAPRAAPVARQRALRT